MALVSRESIKKVVGGALKAGQKIGYSKVQKAMGSAGVNPRYKGSVKTYQATAVFRKLKEAKMLSGTAAQAGTKAFLRAVKRAEAPVGPTKEQLAGRAKVALRKRLTEEESVKKKISGALQKGGKGNLPAGRQGKGEEKAVGPGIRPVSAPAARPVAPAPSFETPSAEQPEPESEPAVSPVVEEESPAIPSAGEAKDLPLD